MRMDDGYAHITSAQVSCGADEAFAYLTSLERMAEWNLNMSEIEVVDDALAKGVVTQIGTTVWVQVQADASTHTIHFFVGGFRDQLVPRIMIRVVSGECLGTTSEQCVVSMMAWRLETMDDERWRRLIAAHEYEILQIKTLLDKHSE